MLGSGLFPWDGKMSSNMLMGLVKRGNISLD